MKFRVCYQDTYEQNNDEQSYVAADLGHDNAKPIHVKDQEWDERSQDQPARRKVRMLSGWIPTFAKVINNGEQDKKKHREE